MMAKKTPGASVGRADKSQAVRVLEEMAVLLELKDANVFKIRAFQNAARALESDPRDLAALVRGDELEKIKGIGKGISAVLRELFEKGKSAEHAALRKDFPDSLFELFRIPGLGAKRIKAIYGKLGVSSIDVLEDACGRDLLLDLEGFGAKSQEKVLEGIRQIKKTKGLFLLSFAAREGEKVTAYLKKIRGVSKIEAAGSLRRSKEIIRDIDILASASDPASVHAAFIQYPEAAAVTAHGETKSAIVLKSGMACDLRTVTEGQFPFALYYFTGSKEHNVAVRTIAKKKNLKINEYGLFRGSRRIACRSEEEIFGKLGLHYVPPEARENTGEIEWAAGRKFPTLVEARDLRGIFHVHTTASDGRETLEKVVLAAQRMGMEYIGISDHSRSAFYAGGLDARRLRRQSREIDVLQKRCSIRIFKGIESEVHADGRLDYPDRVLAQLDFVIASVHSHFSMPEKEMTGRLRRAMGNRYVTFLGHPTGRLLLARAGYAVDVPALIDEAARTGVVMELNANPQRLDLDWRMCRYARERGVLVGINPDAHDAEGLADIRYGVGIARKGWLRPEDVLNTLSAKEVGKALGKRR